MRWPDVRLAVATRPARLEDLTVAERVNVPAATSARRADWLLGRAALKRLLGGADTSVVRFPHRCLSLTHAGGLAVAAGAAAHGDQAGVGVDYEPLRPVDPRLARFFLRDGEEGDLLRLWTVKEALFKATPGNEGAMLGDYAITAPGRAADERDNTFVFRSRRFRRGWLTVAVCT